jgi:hypothetical protein
VTKTEVTGHHAGHQTKYTTTFLYRRAGARLLGPIGPRLDSLLERERIY